jgi:hypothetical protein
MKILYCIECGRELQEYISETLQYCNICESHKRNEFSVYGKRDGICVNQEEVVNA